MKAIAIYAYGGTEVFTEIDADTPVARPGHVIIDVRATSVNPVDTKIRKGSEGTAGLKFPAILHIDVAGIISSVGTGVTRFKVGDEVYGCFGGIVGIPGALADQMEADANMLALKPKILSFGEAASLPLVAITAWEALVDKASIQPDDNVLVHGGTGGVAHIGIQLAKVLGARVSTTVSNQKKAAIACRLGADEIIFYEDESPDEYHKRITKGDGFDVVFDTLGGQVLQDSLRVAKLKGHVISTIGYDTYDLTDMHFKALRLDIVFMAISIINNVGRAHHGNILERLAALVDRGQIKTLIDSKFEFSLDGVRAAHARLESGNTIGKVIIERSN
ncbi:zinc-dependent alcohol dehydrogenase family protein [Pseudomonas fragi]|uniref:zinc-dependent alcohol dehydrogenase family protein n=1 Tax=Pseudomonas TaxID=286 RepID=UPI0014751133|nr:MULTISPECIES: zinc-dependent alcohol dehydrogenase family protein [Pseudomonas]MBM1202047.1 zinc-dependent alcohol dehydrogenase family protein [Pseudomonas fragi]MEC4167714.1 zinc-dependent alcohol dehydrogenase family protein [Pseudomonas sp. MS-1(2024)]NNB18045.1 zinc-dependent alcohol dehydrogenase family protein [Pseudomonas fragi]NNB22893.1 zinc-dependent alcohol dehydrogenase family protein [Pseudomonas fragi]